MGSIKKVGVNQNEFASKSYINLQGANKGQVLYYVNLPKFVAKQVSLNLYTINFISVT